MPHDHLLKTKYLVVAIICLLFVNQASEAPITFAQPGFPNPAKQPRTWSEPASLSDPNDSVDSMNPDIAVCADGTIYVVWVQNRELWYSVNRPSMGWSEASQVRDKQTGLFVLGSEPSIAVSTNCVLHLAWTKSWGFYDEIFYTFNEGDGFVIPENVSRTSDYQGQSGQPDIAVDGDGTPRIVWVDTVTGKPQLFEGWRIPGAPWPKREIRGGDGQVQVPAFGIDHDAGFHLTWMRQDGLASDIFYKRPEYWTAAWVENVSESSSTESRLPDLAISDNRVVIIWQEDIGGDDEIYARWRLLDSPSFESVTNLSHSDASSRSPAVAADGFGDFLVAWDEGDPTDAILTRPWPAVGDWQEVSGISNGGVKVRNPAIAASPQASHVYAVWAQKDGPNDDMLDIYLSGLDLTPYRFYLGLVMRGHKP